MDKKYQDIKIAYEDRYVAQNGTTMYNIRHVTIKSIQTTDLFIKINVVDEKEKSSMIIVPKLCGVHVLIE